MHTFTSITRATSVAAAPSAVFAFVSDPDTLPTWAPDFVAQAMPFSVRSSADQGTTDIVVSETPPGGAFMRVLPNGDGCEVVLTVIFPVPVDEAVVAAQGATVDAELAAIRSLCGG